MSLSINYLAESQLKDVVDISNSQFGVGYLNTSDFTSDGAIVLVATDDEKVVGFALFYIIGGDDFPAQLSIFYPVAHTSVFFKSIAVLPGFENRGVGSHLMQMVLNLARNQGVLCCYGYLWVKDGKMALESIARHHGFHDVKVMPRFWQQVSIDKGFDCPVCGNPCRCDALMVCRPFVKQ